MENAKKHQAQQLKAAAAEEASAKSSTASAADRSPSPAIAVVAVKPATAADGDVQEGDDPSPSGGKKVFSRLGPKLTVSDRLGSPVAPTAPAAESKPASKHR